MEVEEPENDIRVWAQSLCMTPNEALRTWNALSPEQLELRKYWRLAVPSVMALGLEYDCISHKYDERAIYENLLEPLERYVFGKNSEEVLKQLRASSEKSSTICAKVFLMSEPTYSCKDCSTDPTCVLCSDCFNKSEHINHRYKMSISMGGGCCDCGDAEAWLKSPNCTDHEPVASPSTNQEEEQEENGSKETDCGLSEDMKHKLRVILEVACHYAYELLTNQYASLCPADLKLEETDDDQPDTFCTILYNDESHTFEQVISMVLKVVNCGHKQAIDFVTNIDREGRAIVKCAGYDDCTKTKKDIELATTRNSPNPLTVKIAHSIAVAHQEFALRLLTWLREKILPLNAAVRKLFCDVMMGPQKTITESMAEAIMKNDTHMWKTARLRWHRLFVSGMMMEYDEKLRFAVLFAKHYTFIAQEFIRDDHDHQYSIMSLSVQLFTVPSIAHYLTSRGLLFVLFSVFWSECRKLIKDGQFVFTQNDLIRSPHFKRAHVLLNDTQYVLTIPPTTWTDQLRKEVLNPLSHSFLALLKSMQCMDPVKRQTGQHMEFEADWETSFSLMTKFAPVIRAMAQWCKSDRAMLIKAYRSTIKKLHEWATKEDICEPRKHVEFGDVKTQIIMYDVCSQPVSTHIPLTRFMGLLHPHLQKYGLAFDSEVFLVPFRLSPNEVLEPVLRIFALMAQIHANMWRRNGYSILHQAFYYSNSRFRSDMLDIDLGVIQTCVTLMEADHFLLYALAKFDLHDKLAWAYDMQRRKDEDFIRPILTLLEEYLAMIIHVISNRYKESISVVGETDHLRKEVIQYLCVKPLTRSEIEKLVPESVENTLDTILNEVATFDKPLYTLKAEYEGHYDVFYYHYVKEDMSKSQDYIRGRRRAKHQMDCCPPPQLPALQESYYSINKLFPSKMMLSVMEKVLKNALNLASSMYSEGQVHRVLHLLGYAFNECETGRYPFLGAEYLESLKNYHIPEYLEKLTNSVRVEAHRDLAKWTLKKYKLLIAADQSTSGTLPMETDEISDNNESEKERRSKMAERKRAALMAQMAAQQSKFMKDNIAMLSNAEDDELEEGKDVERQSDFQKSDIVAVGPNRSNYKVSNTRVRCILCQEEQHIDLESEPLVLGALVQKSTVMRRYKFAEHGNPPPLYVKDEFYIHASLGPAMYVSCCGHAMHYPCWTKYHANLLAKESRRPYRLRNPTCFDVEKGEFVCPLCQSLCNTIVPVLPPVPAMCPNLRDELRSSVKFDNFLEGMQAISETGSRELRNVPESSDSESASRVPLQSAAPVAPLSAGYYSYEPRVDAEVPPEVVDDLMEGDEVLRAEVQAILNALPEAQGTLAHVHPIRAAQAGAQPNADPGPITGLGIAIGENAALHVMMFQPDSENTIYQSTESSFSPRIPLHKTLLNTIGRFGDCVLHKSREIVPSVPVTTLKEDSFSRAILIWKACSFTIHVVESVLRVDDFKSLLGDLSFRQDMTLSTLVKVSTLMDNCEVGEEANALAIQLIGFVLDKRDFHSGGCVLRWDTFDMLVTLTMCSPTIFLESIGKATPLPSCGILDSHILKFTTVASVAQILMQPITEEDLTVARHCDQENEQSCEVLGDIMQMIHRHPSFDKKEGISNAILWEYVKLKLRRFLRCCVLFYHYLSGIPAPEVLKEVGGDTYENMCKYLGMDGSCAAILGTRDGNTYGLVVQWILTAAKDLPKGSIKLLKEFLPVNSLVPLPENYSDLMNLVSMFRCPNTKEDCRNPTMCLACGALLCSQSYCCQREYGGQLIGAASYHANSCGGFAGIFLKIRECEILILSNMVRGTLVPAPYVDRYGETDQGLRRGNPLKLCRQSYARLTQLWLSHSLHEEVCRKNESNNGVHVTQWHNM